MIGRTLRSIFFLAAALLVTSPARAEDTAKSPTGDSVDSAEKSYDLSRKLGTTGMVLGFGGPVFFMGGLVTGLDGALETSFGSARGSSTQVQRGEDSLAASRVMFQTSLAMNSVGPAMLATSAMIGSKAVRSAGGEVRRGPAWLAVTGSGIQLLAVAGTQRHSVIGFAGWLTAMGCGAMQHRDNRDAWERTGSASAPSRRRVELAFAPTANGGMVLGTF